MTLIIGGSISGLYAGIRLAKSRIESFLFEKNSEEIEKRKLIITPEILRFIKIPEEIILNRINKFEIISKNQKVKFEIKEPDIVVDRKSMIKYLENTALKEDVKILKEREFEKIFKDKNGWVAEFKIIGTDKKEYYRFKKLIGANGANSEILKSIKKDVNLLYILQAEIVLPSNYKKDTVYVWIDKKYTDFFVWLIPCSEKTGVCGICLENKKIKEKLDEFLKDKNFEIIGYEGGIVPFYEPSLYPEIKLDGGEIYLIGDAGMQIKMTTVGGTLTGLWGAFCVSESISKNLPFERFYKNLKKELDIHFYIRKVLSRMDEFEYDRFLMRTSKKLKQFFYLISRDKLRKIFLKILLREPYLLYLGARKIWKNT